MSFKFVGEDQIAPEERIQCRCCGDAERMRPLDESGQPMYQDGDCTLTPSAEGSCCDRKHWWGGKEYDNVPLEFELHLICAPLARVRCAATNNTSLARCCRPTAM